MARQVIANAISKRGVAERSRRSATRIQAMGISIAGAASMTRRAMEIEMQNTLHLYAQELWHSEAFIAGTMDALEALRNAIDRALADGRGEMSTFAADGEGYAVHVQRVTEEQAGSMVVPYTDERARCGRDDVGVRPWEMPLIIQALQDCEDVTASSCPEAGKPS